MNNNVDDELTCIAIEIERQRAVEINARSHEELARRQQEIKAETDAFYDRKRRETLRIVK